MKNHALGSPLPLRAIYPSLLKAARTSLSFIDVSYAFLTVSFFFFSIMPYCLF